MWAVSRPRFARLATMATRTTGSASAAATTTTMSTPLTAERPCAASPGPAARRAAAMPAPPAGPQHPGMSSVLLVSLLLPFGVHQPFAVAGFLPCPAGAGVRSLRARYGLLRLGGRGRPG